MFRALHCFLLSTPIGILMTKTHNTELLKHVYTLLKINFVPTCYVVNSQFGWFCCFIMTLAALSLCLASILASCLTVSMQIHNNNTVFFYNLNETRYNLFPQQRPVLAMTAAMLHRASTSQTKRIYFLRV